MSTTVERDGETTDADDDETTADAAGDETPADATDGRGTIVTRIDRETTSGLRSTVDDYVANLEVAIDVMLQARTVQHANRRTRDLCPNAVATQHTIQHNE